MSANSVRAWLMARGRPTTPDPVTEEEAIAAMRAYAREKGRQPSHTAWKRERRRPSSTAIAELFGSWANAMVAAGFDGRRAGDWRTYEELDEFDRETAALQARVDAGETLTEIGCELGVTGQALGRRLRRWRDRYGAKGHRVPTAGRQQ